MEILELINIGSSRRRFESYEPFESRPDDLPNIVISHVVTLWVFFNLSTLSSPYVRRAHLSRQHGLRKRKSVARKETFSS